MNLKRTHIMTIDLQPYLTKGAKQFFFIFNLFVIFIIAVYYNSLEKKFIEHAFVKSFSAELTKPFDTKINQYQTSVLYAQNQMLSFAIPSLNTYILIAFFFTSLSTIIFYIKFKQSKKKEKQLNCRLKNYNEIQIRKKLAQLRLMTLRSQMEPHFIFNILHAIQNYILVNKNKEASDYLAKFSKLLRLILHNSENTEARLNDEVDAIKIYLELEKLRYGNKFNFTVNFPANIAALDLHIPAMIIQPHIENAINHGLSNNDKNGSLFVDFALNEKKLVIKIEDNGVGRKKAAEIAKQKPDIHHNNIAHQNIFTRLVELGQIDKNDYQIIDKFDSKGNPNGTTVVIKLRYNY